VTRDGTLVDDFLWVTDRRCLHVCNAPSPAATASLEIARCIVNQTKHSLANLDSRIGSKEFKP
jgi:L-2-hydroxyglutarate oxidase LhgO